FRAITLEMALSSTLKEIKNSLICPFGSLVVGSRRLASIVSGEMASPLAVGTHGSTLSIMMVVAFKAQSPNVGVPPRQGIYLKSTSCKLILTCNSVVAYMENRFYLFEPLSKTNNSFSTLKIYGLTFEEAPVTTLWDTNAQTRFETASKNSHDPPLLKVNTSGSGEDSMKHQDDLVDFIPPTPYDSPLLGGHILGSDEGRPNINELMNICKQLLNKVLALEQFKIAQDLLIKRLKKKVKILEKKQRARNPRMKLFKLGTSKKKTLDKENDVNIAELVFTASDVVNAAGVIPDVSAAGPSTSVIGPSTSTAEDTFKDEMTTIADKLMAIRRIRSRTTSVMLKKNQGEQHHQQYKSKTKQAKSSKKRSRADHDKEGIKKQKIEEGDAKKEELRACLDIVLVDDTAINVESLATK
nr:hypothetical protein [Tanacetum cinerariifolium]